MYFYENQKAMYIAFKRNVSNEKKQLLLDKLEPEIIITPVDNNIYKLSCEEESLNSNLFSIDTVIDFYSKELVSFCDSTIYWTDNSIYVALKDNESLNQILQQCNIENFTIENFDDESENEYMVFLRRYDNIDNIISLSNQIYETGKVKACHPNMYWYVKVHNPYYSQQWNLNNTGQNNGIAGIDINVEKAWEITSGNNIKIAVLDCGVDLTHPDLAGNLLQGYDATTTHGGTAGGYEGNMYHGTNCAGVVGAINNNIGVKGVAYSSKIIPIRAYLEHANNYTMAKAIYLARKNGADVLSCSWEAAGVDMVDTALYKAVHYGRSGKGCVLVFSTGNENLSQVEYPARSEYTLAVGAISQCAERLEAGVSCDGLGGDGSNYGNDLCVVAPGAFIPTTDIQGYYRFDFKNTSAACPHVSGVAALVLSVKPTLTYSQVMDVIERTARKVGNYEYGEDENHLNGDWNEEMGYGLVDAHRAVMYAYYCYDSNITCSATNVSLCNEYSYGIETVTLLPNTTFNWRVSDNLRIVSGQNSANVTIMPTNIGVGTITFDFIRLGDTVSITKNINIELPSNAYHNYSTSSDLNINSDNIIAGTFTINNGNVVTISSNISCLKNSKIVVMPGGKLVLDGATLTNLSCSDDMWNGIYVVGNSYQQQLAANQGTLEIKNNSLIENAEWGIITWNGYDYGTSGGIVKCSNSTFHNNGRAVEFYPYTNHDASNNECSNVSYLKNCNFTIDDNNIFASSNVTYTDMIKMNGVSGIPIRGCHFSDNRTGMPTRGNAIHIADASANIKPSCSFGDYTPYLPCNCTGESRNTFSGFAKGIYAENTGTNYPFYVFKANFEKCERSVSSSAVNNYKVTMSDFNMTRTGNLSSMCGIYSESSTGYKIEGNNFYTEHTTNPSGFNSFGISIGYSGSDENTIYRNSFDKLTYGILSGPDNNSLQVLCNEFTNSFSIDVWAIASISLVQGSSSASAGNKFTIGKANFYLGAPDLVIGSIVNYYHSDANSSTNIYCPYNSYNVIKVPNITANECEPTICIVPIYPPINPPINPKSSSTSDDISLYESLQQEYESRLAEYSAAGYGFLLENFEENDADIVALARLKQDTLISIHRAMAEIANRNIDAILQDTLIFDREALNGWYNRINTTTAKYSLVNSYFEVGEYALARQELAAIPQRFALSADELAEYDNFCQYQSLRESVYASGRNYAQFTETEIAELQTIAERNTGVSSAYANSVLCFFYGICRDEELDLDFDIDAPMNSKSTTAVAESDAEQLAIYVYPNPADEELNILLNSLPEGRTTIEFHDVTGRLVLSEEIKSNSTSINISSLRQGVYMYRIVNGDNVIARDRIVKE